MTEYLLASNAATLNHLAITIESVDTLECPDYFGEASECLPNIRHLAYDCTRTAESIDGPAFAAIVIDAWNPDRQ